MKINNIILATLILILFSCGQSSGVAPTISATTGATDPSCPTFVNGDMALPATSSILSGTAPTGWTGANYSTGFLEVYKVHSSQSSPAAGQQAASFGGSGATLTQVLTGLTVGNQYTISFEAGSDLVAAGVGQLSVNGVVVKTTPTLPQSFAPFTSSVFTATSTTATVVFTDTGTSQLNLTAVVLNCL
ncbi:hypothetical protein DOM21_02330 [Bacteriovorax stolpii]|uniref:Uncharacterized protein n=1 Tax=Bacteriovorax stolpii TaxID=960 RepID=A0A2K9NVZ7_BACTC|nr:hypothetical protein [Bacteriovorax stolpii]AUN99692.1 hypothetical protein C0V70_16580 [Bacteriovorax stolpii]QDK40310.1 hypothetical protein DOM21_02330 [Bacteriovorax stolpii]TDP51326.1 hypothetical protein C8D79_3499 [Bacteriovorax stolpii]